MAILFLTFLSVKFTFNSFTLHLIILPFYSKASSHLGNF